jgi:hypothetical protein
VARVNRYDSTKKQVERSIAKPVPKPKVHERKNPQDSHDVREWFAADPSACVSNPSAQKILRAYEHEYRPWIKFPGKLEERTIRSAFEKAARVHVEQRFAHGGKRARAAALKKVLKKVEKGVQTTIQARASGPAQALVSDQVTPWSESLRNHLKEVLPQEVVERFADYLTGFLLIQENETPRRSATWEDRSRTSNAGWRELKKFLPVLNGGPGDLGSMLPASTCRPHEEALKTKLTRLMSQELFELIDSRKEIARNFLPKIWDAIGEGILDRSFLRTERRSRRRTAQRK